MPAGTDHFGGQPAPGSWRAELLDLVRAASGGLLFGVPLLYTMEMWFAGLTARPSRLIVYVLVTYVLLLGYNRYAGLREDASFAEVAIDSVEEMGLGVVIATVVLWLCGRLTGEMTGAEIVNQIVVEAMTVAIGVSVGTAQLGGEGQTESGGEMTKINRAKMMTTTRNNEARKIKLVSAGNS